MGPYVSDTTLEGTGDDREALQASGRERGIRSSMCDIWRQCRARGGTCEGARGFVQAAVDGPT